MSLVFGGTTVNNIVFNGTTIDRIVFNGVEVYTSKPATFIYWDGEFGTFLSNTKPRRTVYFQGGRNYVGNSGVRCAYYNSDGIYFQDREGYSPIANSRLELPFSRKSPYNISNAPLIVKDVYVAIDNFVGNPINASLYLFVYSEDWEGKIIANYPIEQYFTVSGNTVLHLHVDYVENNNFGGSFRFYDNSVGVPGTSYVIRRIWYDTY